MSPAAPFAALVTVAAFLALIELVAPPPWEYRSGPILIVTASVTALLGMLSLASLAALV